MCNRIYTVLQVSKPELTETQFCHFLTRALLCCYHSTIRPFSSSFPHRSYASQHLQLAAATAQYIDTFFTKIVFNV